MGVAPMVWHLPPPSLIILLCICRIDELWHMQKDSICEPNSKMIHIGFSKVCNRCTLKLDNQKRASCSTYASSLSQDVLVLPEKTLKRDEGHESSIKVTSYAVLPTPHPHVSLLQITFQNKNQRFPMARSCGICKQKQNETKRGNKRKDQTKRVTDNKKRKNETKQEEMCSV